MPTLFGMHSCDVLLLLMASVANNSSTSAVNDRFYSNLSTDKTTANSLAHEKDSK